MIGRGKLPIGKEISIKKLGEDTGYPDDVIQKSLAILANEDIIDLISNENFRIRRIKPHQLQDLKEESKKLERLIVQELAKKFDHTKFNVLEESVKKNERGGK